MAMNPYAWAYQYAQTANQEAENARQRSERALLSLFAEEAARQRPYATMPATLAEAEFNRRNAMPYELAKIRAQTAADLQQRRNYYALQLEQKKRLAAAGLAPTYNPNAAFTDPAAIAAMNALNGQSTVSEDDTE